MNGQLHKPSDADLLPCLTQVPQFDASIKYPELHVKKLPAFLSNYDCLRCISGKYCNEFLVDVRKIKFSLILFMLTILKSKPPNLEKELLLFIY